MSIDLCVVNFRTPHLVKRLLDHLHADDDGISWRLWIANNESGDASPQQLKEWQQSDQYRIEEVVLNENVGYARACNDLALKGSSPYLALLNSDIWFTTADVRAIERRFEENPVVAVIGPKQRDEAQCLRHAGIFSDIAPHHRGWGTPDPHDALYRDVLPCETVSGSAYFVRRTVWDEMTACPLYRDVAPDATGAFLPTNLFWEESYNSLHMRKHGYVVMYDGTVSIGHTWHGSTEHGSGEVERFVPDSQQYFRRACDHHGMDHD